MCCASNRTRSPAALHTIRIHGGEAAPAYAEALAQWKREGAALAGKSLFIEAEAADYKSDQTLYPLNDRTSPNSTPYDHKCVKYNTIGADHWQMPGQWLEWDIEVPRTACTPSPCGLSRTRRRTTCPPAG